jgi:hypothetical protein
MRKIVCFFAVIFMFSSLLNTLFALDSPYFTYLEPAPGAKYINKECTIMLKPSGLIMKSSITDKSLLVTGTKSGNHSGEIIKSDDNSTLIFKPFTAFELGDVVTVKLNENIKTAAGKGIEPIEYSFIIKSSEIQPDPLKIMRSELGINEVIKNPSERRLNGINDFPQITVTTSLHPSDGYILLSNIAFNINILNTPYLMMLNNSGVPYFSRNMPMGCLDFKAQPNGNYTYYDTRTLKFYELDKSYNIIDSFYCGNGYITDVHELRLLDNGHALLMSYDPEIVNMVQYLGTQNPGDADTAAVVSGLIIQEIDANKNVVFQWRSWDHYKITDATHEDFNAHIIDYVHGNAIELDNDGTLLISCRHMDEITKINRTTGAMIWRLGGKNNQFTFINDPIGFSHQHAIRRIKNGNITLFDNGNFHTPSFSRAVEYALDEQNKTAVLVWQYRNNPDIYGFAMGYVQRLDNGNTLISWGAANPSVTEVRYDGTKEYELSLPQGVFSYRASRYQPVSQPVIPSQFSLSQNYPNPFNPSTKIQFSLPKDSYVRLTIYDELGRQVAGIVDGTLKAGSYETEWNASQFASGIYFYRLVTDGFSQTNKMVLIK